MNRQQEPYTIADIVDSARAYTTVTATGSNLANSTEVGSGTVVVTSAALSSNGIRVSGPLTSVINVSQNTIKAWPPTADTSLIGSGGNGQSINIPNDGVVYHLVVASLF